MTGLAAGIASGLPVYEADETPGGICSSYYVRPGKAEAVDPTCGSTWAYTWAWPGSTWRAQAIRLLEEHSVYMVGRYARWMFQGLADSIRDGLLTGACFRGR